MSCRRSCVIPRNYGTCFYPLRFPGRLQWNASIYRTCSSQQTPQDKPLSAQEWTSTALKNVTETGKHWGRKSVKSVTATANYWWHKYEEFVGLNEVREAQTKVTEAEKQFMVARGMVREAHSSLETLQARLKEVRDRLDRVSREEAHYLELATLEHKLLQEERRFKTAYENAEEGEREKFALFSAGVRESHEKERSRAERTKNWSIIGSVLGAIIGVMGSTYINRVRLQELKSLLLEAQKGPVSLQEAIKTQASLHKDQREELRDLIETLRVAVKDDAGEGRGADRASVPLPMPAVATPPKPSISEGAVREMLLRSERAQVLMEDLKPQLKQLEQSMGRVTAELQAVKKSVKSRPAEPPVIQASDAQLLVCDTETVIKGLDHTEKRLEAQINKSAVYNTVLTYTAFALTMPVLYIIFKGTQ
ncbi:mitochondrial potassium channel [Brachyhypopomus gauderio]|uniref:mitochondrial potassium channel n=1 Tax=Brachyhypopomus gauderio TaxID=698409 RepID=UPI004041B67C